MPGRTGQTVIPSEKSEINVIVVHAGLIAPLKPSRTEFASDPANLQTRVSAVDLMSCCPECEFTPHDGCKGGHSDDAWTYF